MMMEEEMEQACTIPYAYSLKLGTAALLEQMGLSDVQASQAVFEFKDTPIPFLGHRTGREFLVEIGDGMRRFAREDCWVRVNEVLRRRGLSGGYDVIVDDIRKENEYDSLSAVDAIMIKVVRPSKTGNTNMLEGRLEARAWQHTIVNDGSLSQLREKVRKVLHQEHLLLNG